MQVYIVGNMESASFLSRISFRYISIILSLRYLVPLRDWKSHRRRSNRLFRNSSPGPLRMSTFSFTFPCLLLAVSTFFSSMIATSSSLFSNGVISSVRSMISSVRSMISSVGSMIPSSKTISSSDSL